MVIPTVAIHAIPDGDAGTVVTVRYMIRAARDAASAPLTKLRAQVWAGLTGDPWTMARNIRRELARQFVYQDDPGAETLYAPAYLIEEAAEHGTITGDCDDLATLAAALLLAVGIQCEFVVVSTDPFPSPYRHVYAVALIPPSKLLTVTGPQVYTFVDFDLQRPANGVHVTRSAAFLV